MTEAVTLPTDTAARQLRPASTSASTSITSIDQTAPVPEKPPGLPYKYYHQYCFQMSPTFNRFCPMRVRDLLRLDQFDAFEGQHIFFHLNHPIKWVRVSGVVVSFQDYNGRHAFTIDDGSGTAIECVLPYVRPQKSTSNDPSAGVTSMAESVPENTERIKRADALRAELVGKVIDVRGDLYLFRTEKRGDFLQIHIIKHKVLHGTQQEVEFWNKVNTFARDTLNEPWVVDKQVVRACRKAAQGCNEAAKRSIHKQSKSKEPAKLSSTDAARETSSNAEIKQPATPAPRVLKKKWQIRQGAIEGDEPMEDIPEHEAMELDDHAPTARQEAEAQTSYTQGQQAARQTQPVQIDDQPPRQRLPKKWNIG